MEEKQNEIPPPPPVDTKAPQLNTATVIVPPPVPPPDPSMPKLPLGDSSSTHRSKRVMSPPPPPPGQHQIITTMEIPTPKLPTIKNTFVVTDCPIQRVTVYQDKAEICRLAKVRVGSGQVTEVVFQKLSAFIDPESIRMRLQGQCVIQDVVFQTRQLEHNELQHQRDQNDLKSRLKQELRRQEAFLVKRNNLEKQQTILETFANTLIVSEGCSSGLMNGEDSVGTNSQDTLKDRYEPKNMEMVKSFFQLYEEQADKLYHGLSTIRDELELIDGNIREIEDTLKEMEHRHIESLTRELTVYIESSITGQVELYFFYVVSNACWSPCYDIRIFNNEAQLKIVYHGVVQQATGEDWNSSEIYLSTSQPGIGGTAPELGIQKMQFLSSKIANEIDNPLSTVPTKTRSTPGTVRNTKARVSMMLPGQSVPEGGRTTPCLARSTSIGPSCRTPLGYSSMGINGGSVSGLPSNPDSPFFSSHRRSIGGSTTQSTTDLLEGELSSPTASSRFGGQVSRDDGQSLSPTRRKFDNSSQMQSVVYTVPRSPTSISCDNKPHRLTVGIIDLSPMFEYIAAPKKSPHAYVKAVMQNSSKYALLPGPTNIYVDGNFVGKSEMSAVAPQEEFTCKLGADPGIKVHYNPMYKYKEVNTSSGKNVIFTFKQEIEVKNTHERTIRLVVLDQLPLSAEDKIKVNLIEPAIKHPEKYDKTKQARVNKSNIVEWEIDLKPNEERQLVLKYSVEHPVAEEVAFFDT